MPQAIVYEWCPRHKRIPVEMGERRPARSQSGEVVRIVSAVLPAGCSTCRTLMVIGEFSDDGCKWIDTAWLKEPGTLF